MTTLLADLVATSGAVTATRSRTAKLDALARQLRALQPGEARLAAPYLAGATRQERLDVGWAALRDVRVQPAERPTLTVADVDAALAALAAASGKGSRQDRLGVLAELLGRATGEEQDFLRALVLGELRQGALEGLLAQAVAAAAAVPEAIVRRALMLSGDLGVVAEAVLTGGEDALAAFGLTLFRPVQPMLASTAATVTEAVGDLGRAAVEFKLDGARVQVHRRGDEVRVYTRNLRDATARSPEVVAAVRALPAEQLILDGEVLALRPDGRPEAFQDTMSRFGRQRTPSPTSLTPFFFDLLHLDGTDLLDAPAHVRMAALDRLVPPAQRIPHRVVDDPEAGEQVLAEALDAGHEGVMVKALDAPYEAGRRGAAWRKVKPVHTLDLVVLGVEWGSGRRRGWLSNLHLGARDPDSGGFVMLGKTFKGLTDELLAWQTQRFLELEERRDGHVVYVRPEQVVEIAFDGLQASSRYPAGLALRFARVRRYRDDKTAADADTIDTVRAHHERRG
jgi:DNA ligase-1